MQAVLLIGPYDSEDMIVLQVLVAHRDAIWSIWQVPLLQEDHGTESQNFLEKPHILLLRNRFWLVDTECSTMSYQVSLRPEMLIINWVLSDLPSHKVGHVQQPSIIKEKQMYEMGLKQDLKTQVNCVKEVVQMTMPPTSLRFLLSLNHIYDFPMIISLKKKQLTFIYR